MKKTIICAGAIFLAISINPAYAEIDLPDETWATNVNQTTGSQGYVASWRFRYEIYVMQSLQKETYEVQLQKDNFISNQIVSSHTNIGMNLSIEFLKMLVTGVSLDFMPFRKKEINFNPSPAIPPSVVLENGSYFDVGLLLGVALGNWRFLYKRFIIVNPSKFKAAKQDNTSRLSGSGNSFIIEYRLLGNLYLLSNLTRSNQTIQHNKQDSKYDIENKNTTVSFGLSYIF